MVGVAVLASLLAPAPAGAAAGEIAVARAGGIDLVDGAGRSLRTLVPPVVGSYQAARDPAWSPDGRQLAYEQGGWLWIASADGGGRRRVLRGASQPAWSPDGQRLAVVRIATGDSTRFEPTLWLVAPDGSGLERVPHQHFALAPSWFPGGDRLAFTEFEVGSDALPGPTYVATVQVDGSDQRRLTASGADSDPAVSPDGTYVAFAHADDLRGSVMLVDATGNDLHAVSSGELVQGAPAWSPDGARLVVERLDRRRDQVELATLGRDGSCPTRITRSLVSELAPAWRPGAAPGAPECAYGLEPVSVPEGPSFDASSSALSLDGLRAFRAFGLLWAGQRMPGYDLTGVTRTALAVTFLYDCSIDRVSCPRGLAIAIHPRRPRLGCSRPRDRRFAAFRVRGVEGYRFDGWTQVPTGGIAVVLGGPQAAVRTALPRLRTVSATRPRVGAGTRLPAPLPHVAGPGCAT